MALSLKSLPVCVCVCVCSVAYRNCSLCMDDLEESRSQALKELLRDYFDKRRNLDLSKHYQEEEDEEEELNKCKVCDLFMISP